LEKENAPAKVEEPKPKQKKKKGKIRRVYEMHQKGVSVKEIAEKMKISERVVSSYIWRAANPEKYKELLNRYFAKKREKQENEKKEA
jgi:predicted transcriptional regulator